ncbi:MAG: M20 family metallo-hydrolase [Armatimonadota bacterium]|nr:M20 family metallo-hydrolase [Armatimonadota bacterium]MDR7533946.1 M20 family metallo-hydrolase [Armatimonadota bacterium]MDR7536414.1 M20 family metallo-hydrolase [Armatimonadota bacterium]
MTARVASDRLRDTVARLATIGATARGGVTRLALTDEDKAARDLLARWMQDIGLDVAVDDVGNMYGRRMGEDPAAAPVAFGSHLDTVIRGGRFDGALGVAAALEAMRTLAETGQRTKRSLVLVNWTNEEGVRFSPAMLGSGVVAGRFDRGYADKRQAPEGRTFGEELERIGYRGNASERLRRVAAYVELHIEQGPVLEELGVDIGVVEGIQGISWSTCRIEGQAGHAGTTPMARRRDALAAAAELVLAASQLPTRVGGELVSTVGRLRVSPNAINIIPECVEFSLDLRAPREDTLTRARTLFAQHLTNVRSRGYHAAWEEFWVSEPTVFAPAVVAAIERTARAQGLRTHRMRSGAGHDAKHAADLGPAGMIFVPCRGGRSHAEDEDVPWETAVAGAQVLLDVVVTLAAQ